MIAQRNWFPPALPDPIRQLLLLTEPEGPVADLFLLNKLLPPANSAESMLTDDPLPPPESLWDC